MGVRICHRIDGQVIQVHSVERGSLLLVNLANPNHDPNTHHVLCGADADLIMLGLATHEPNFTIIREEFKPNKDRPCEICGQGEQYYLRN
jgi:hypothetical protein